MNLYDELCALIGKVRARWIRLVALQTAARASAGAAVVVATGAIVERALQTHGIPLVILAVATAMLAVAMAGAAVWLKPRRPLDRQVARFIEERAARLTGQAFDDSLVSAVDAGDKQSDPADASFLPLLLGDAVRKLRAIEPAELVPYEEIRRRAVHAAGGAAMLLLALVAAIPLFERAAETARLRFFPESVRVEVRPGHLRVPVGTSVRIRASLHGTSGVLSRFTPELRLTANGERRTVAMAPAGEGFEYVIGSVDRTFSYVVGAGSAQSSSYTVTALTPPRVERIDLHYIYPAFAGLSPRDERDGGDIYAPSGTRVRFSIHTDKPVERGEMSLGRSAALPLRASGGRTFEAELLLAKDDSYRIRLADADGLTSSGEAEYFIRLMEDRPPGVRILRPSADQQITPLEEVAIEARADDDYGISRFELVYAVAGGAERVVPFDRITGTSAQRIGTRLLPAEELGVKPGDVVTYYARAQDIGRGKRSTEATSDIFFLEVKPFNEEFVSAESQAGAGGSDPQLEGLIAAQKEIIASTWNVERRSRGGRSADDVRAIAAAQAELKARAERQVSRVMRGRGGAPAPERLAPLAPQARRPADDPVAAAVAAMGKAFDELSSERTKEALTHEMTALNGLLAAQAEVRRRQVSQQANGAGSGGSNRAGQDLSALFDKELQRQQRTNYETRSAAETRPDSADPASTALDRIRDLARRQEDLSRRERELAEANLNAEEMKRQLEKLTREQTELRQQAEELLRRNNGGPDSSGRSGSTRQPAGTGGSAGNEEGKALRDAADRMGSAASNLRRDDPAAAARSGEGAADQLRRLERQMQQATPGNTARRGSGVQLEARQIAQEQGRIAAEATRLEHMSGAVAAEARKRLAGEKEGLASRVDELGRWVRQLGQSAPGSEAKPLQDASRDLQTGRVADQMRDGAKQMRQGGTGSGAGEQELARALDRIADKLGAVSSPLSDQLAETRAIRDRLQRAEQQLRDAEARAQRGARGSGTGQGEAARGQSAQPGRQGGGAGERGGDVQRLREQYQQELQRAQQALGRLNGGEPRSGMGGTPEEEQFSRSAPGTEAFKQDRTGWETLRKNLDSALEKYEAAASDRLSRTGSEQRLSAGGSDRVPDAYGQLIARYFESLARKKP